jgi:enoyl-CoA hydratase/carnithine racemase
MKTLATLDKPVIAAVDGLAVGIGTTMLFHCDFVVASEWSIFSSPFADLGLPPEAGSSLLAPGVMGHHLAFELLVMGEQFDAQRALVAGLINRVVVPQDLESVALGYARSLSAKPPQAVRLARRLMRGDRREVVHRISLEANSFAELMHSPAAHDALLAFLDRNRD